jgi:hypothetical protein
MPLYAAAFRLTAQRPFLDTGKMIVSIVALREFRKRTRRIGCCRVAELIEERDETAILVFGNTFEIGFGEIDGLFLAAEHSAEVQLQCLV